MKNGKRASVSTQPNVSRKSDSVAICTERKMKQKNEVRVHAKEGKGRKQWDISLVCQKAMDIFLFFVFGLFPVVTGIGDYGYQTIIETKVFVWFAMMIGWILVMAVLFVYAAVHKERIPVRFGWIQRIAVLFLAVNIVSACLSDDPVKSFFQVESSNTNSVIFLASYVLLFIGASLFTEPKRVHILALVLSTSVCGLIAILQAAGYNPLGLYPSGYENGYEEFSAYLGTIGNVDFLAAYLCFVVPVLTVYAIRSKNKKDRLLLIPAALGLVAMNIGGADAGKIGILGCLVLATPVVIPNRKASIIAGIICFFLIISGLTAVYFWPGESGMFYEASQILHGNLDPMFGTGRVNTWIDGWGYFLKHPIIGNGPGSAAWLYLSSRSLNLRTGYLASAYNAHNVYLGYLIEGGIFSLLGYLVLIGIALTGWVRKRKNPLAAALGAGVVCYLIQDFFNLGMVTAAPLLWAGMGLLAGAVKVEGEVR